MYSIDRIMTFEHVRSFEVSTICEMCSEEVICEVCSKEVSPYKKSQTLNIAEKLEETSALSNFPFYCCLYQV